jgi:hypothetical protein
MLICDNEERKKGVPLKEKKGVIHFPNPKL